MADTNRHRPHHKREYGTGQGQLSARVVQATVGAAKVKPLLPRVRSMPVRRGEGRTKSEWRRARRDPRPGKM